MQTLVPVAALAAPAARPQAATTAERWLHVKVTSSTADGEIVRVNLPLSLAEKILPTIDAHELSHGKLTIHEASINGVDLRALAEAVRMTPDSEFVRVENRDESVHIRKAGGDLLITVRGKGHAKENVDVKIPFRVVAALVSGPKDQLDLVAAIHALEAYGDTALVTVEDDSDNVKIWVDSRNASN